MHDDTLKFETEEVVPHSIHYSIDLNYLSYLFLNMAYHIYFIIIIVIVPLAGLP